MQSGRSKVFRFWAKYSSNCLIAEFIRGVFSVSQFRLSAKDMFEILPFFSAMYSVPIGEL